MAKKQVVSPAATGGAGTIFEYRVAAIVLTHLLGSGHPPGLLVPLVGVGLQQRVRGHLLDDIVVYGDMPPASLFTEFQVKRTLTATPGDEEFIEVITQALHRLNEQSTDAADSGDLGLGIVADGFSEALSQLAELCVYAKGHTNHQTFADVLVKNVVDAGIRTRLEKVRAAVALAIERGAPDLGGVDQSTHALLSVLHVWCASAGDDGSDFRAALDRLTPFADSFGVTSIGLFSHLAALAESWGPVAGVVKADDVLRQLRRRGLRLKGASGSAATTPSAIDVDGVVRGPIASLGLQDDVAEAERLLDARDAGAVSKFAGVAARLESAHFLPHATRMRRRQADSLQAVGRDDDAVVMRIGIAWDALDAVQLWEAGSALMDGRRHPGTREAVTPATQRARIAADCAVRVAKGDDIDDFLTAFDQLTSSDPDAVRASLFLCEEAIADARPSLLLDRLPVLEAIATAASNDRNDLARQHAARIQMCLADATGRWVEYLRAAHRRYPRPVLGWLHARYARHLALAGDGAGAQEHYLEAIDRACTEEMFDEAADWLYAWRTVLTWYDDILQDEQHPRAQTLRPHAKPNALPGSPHTAEQALHAMQDADKPGLALQAVRRWRWQAVVRGHLTDEVEALETLGILLQREGDIDSAIKCFVRAGSNRAADAARSLPEALPRLDRRILTAVPPCRAMAYSAAAAATDLLSDEDAQAWAAAALTEAAAADRPARWLGPSPWLAAFDVLAATCDVLSEKKAGQLLHLAEPLIDRPTDHYRHTDEAVAKILVALATRRSDALPLLARALIADQRMAEEILKKPDILSANRDAMAKLLAPFASENRYACLGLIRAGADPAPVLALAAAEVERELTPREHRPGHTPFYAGAPQAAVLASVLNRETRVRFAFTMLERALDQREANYSRWNDLLGLTNIVSDIDKESQASLLSQVLEIARGQHDSTHAGNSIDRTGSLTYLALTCAAQLSPDPSERIEIEKISLAHLREADEPAQWSICRALALLPPTGSILDLWQCAVHPLAALRALAAVRWSAEPAALPRDSAESLARDHDPRVRRALARALRDRQASMATEEMADITRILEADIRRSVRLLAVSRLERLHHDI